MNSSARRILAVVAAIGLGACLTSSASATLITLTNNSLTGLLGGSPTEVGTQTATPMSSGQVKATLYSDVFTNGAGLYAYLYQMDNIGTSGNSSLEQLTLSPFAGASSSTVMGVLTGTPPADLLTGGTAPYTQGFVVPAVGGGTIGFYYLQLFANPIVPGDHSNVMYVLSNTAPGSITGNVIDGAVASGATYGPVPEPATLALLALGAVGLVARRRNRK